MINPTDTPKVYWNVSTEQLEVDCACAASGAASHVLNELAHETVEDDCACASLAPSLFVRDLSFADTWQVATGLHRSALPNAHELLFNPQGSAGVVVLNQPACAILDSYRQAQALQDETARQLAALQLLTPANQTQPATHPSPRVLTAWLHITNACNLRCAYCYLNKTGEAMHEDTGRAAVDAVVRSAQAHGFHAIKLKYAGGEATLHFQLVQTLHVYALAKAAQAGLGLREVLLSNGVALSPKVINWLRGENVRLMISLDGVGRVHDAQRMFTNGQGSFERVVRGIDRALANGLTPHLSITVTTRNVDHLAEVVAFAIERDLPFNLNFFRDNDCVSDVSDLTAENDRLARGMKAAFAVIEANLPRRRLIDALVDRSGFGAPHEHPCGAGHDYLVVDSRGRVARCQMEIEHPITDVQAYDPVAAVRTHTGGFQNIPVDQKQPCRECYWRYWCAGGCPLLTYQATGCSDVKSPYCEVYRELYPDMLRLEGLRLLKWNKPVA